MKVVRAVDFLQEGETRGKRAKKSVASVHVAGKTGMTTNGKSDE
jgi:hypothetical protein